MKNKFDKLKKIWYDISTFLIDTFILVLIPMYVFYSLYYVFFIYGK